MATLPNPNPLTNNAVANYNYFVDPTTTVSNSGQNISNDVSTFINVADAQVLKIVDATIADVGNKITYTIRIVNSGNATASNIVLKDTIPNNTTFSIGSVKINGTQDPGSPAPPTGLNVPDIAPNATTTVTWDVTIDTIPSPNPIPNSANLGYNFILNPVGPVTQPETRNTNIVNTQVLTARITSDNIVKSANPTSGKVGDKITYTIKITNSGNTTANNVVFTDTIPNFTTFNPDSVRLNSVTQTGAIVAPPTGFTIGTLGPNATVTVQFDVTLTALPTVNPIPNQGKVAYTYTVTTPNGQSGQALSNIANVFTNQAVIDNSNGGGMVKTVDKAFAKVGDILTYTVTLKNTGNISANNVVFTDTIPNGTTFNPGSVQINGTQDPGNPAPPTGVNVGTIGPGSATTVLFTVKVDTVPSPNPIPNNSTVNYSYIIDPANPTPTNGSGNSNQVTTQVNQATIDNTNGGGLVKLVDKAFAKVGDVISYTITLKNTGNVSANNVVFTDTIPTDTSFKPGSVIINGAPDPGNPAPPTGVNVGSILPGATTTIIFQVTVNTIPNPNPIPNSGTVNYNFTVDPSTPNGESASGNTNTVNTQVNQATIDNTNGGGMVKSVDKTFAKVGDVLTYTVNLKNTGNVTANNVVFTDTIPSGTSFKIGSVTVNGSGNPGNPEPPTGVNVGSIAPGATTAVQFQVTVTTVPTVNPIPNNSTVRYNYTLDPSVPNGGSASGNSNQVTTQINQATIDNSNGGGLVKSVDKAYADVNEVVTYTITVKNTGNVAANNVVLTDTIPNGTSFNTGSVLINGAPDPGSPAPPTGLTIGTIAAGSATTVVFTVKVNTIPSPNPIPNAGTVNYNYTVDPAAPNAQAGSGNTNIVNTQVNNANFDQNSGGIVKSVDKTNAKVNDTLNYRIVLKNTGNVTANNVVFTDTIPSGTSFNGGSVKVNGGSNPGNPAPPTGINLGSLAPGSTTTIDFSVNITVIPTVNPIPNQGKVAYTYTTNPANPNGNSGQNLSNIVNTTTNQATIDNTNGGGMVKTVDKGFAKVGDVLTYTVTLKNTGNVDANNVIFTDTIPTGTSFNTGSVRVNGTPDTGNPAPPTGINVGTIGAGSATTVLFTVTVNTVPSPNPIPNNSTVNYKFTVDPAFPNGQSGSGNSNQVTTQVNQATIDNTTGGGLVKEVSPKFAKVGDQIRYTITLKNTGNVAANNVVFTDTIPNDTSFVAGSVRVNGAPNTGNPTPGAGISVGSIAAGGASTVVFDVTILTIPSPNPIPNTGTAVFNFTVDPSFPNAVVASGNTNFVNTQVNQAIINNATGSLVKSVDKAYAKVGETLYYTVAVSNAGNVTANNIIFTDTIPSGTSFIANTFAVNGVTVVSGNPQAGVNIGNVAPNTVSTVTFQVTVTTIPSPNPIPNSATTRFTYTIDPSVPNGGSGSGNSNIVNTQVNQATIDNTNGGGLVKSVDLAYADVNDVLTYRIGVRNTGNVAATNVVFKDTIPSGTTFNNNSVTVDGIYPPGNPNPQTGVNLGTIAPGGATTIQFQVTVNTIPTVNPIPNSGTVSYNFTKDPAVPDGATGSGNTNIVTTQVNSGNFDNAPGGAVKSVDKAYAKVGDVVTYTIRLTNTGNVTSNNIVFTDTVPNGTAFNTGSVRVNNVPNAGTPQSGISVGSIAPGQTSTVIFAVTVNTIPSPNPIPNQGKVAYNYTVNPSFPNGKAVQSLTNFVNTQVNQATIDNTNGGGLVKSVDKAFAKVNDVINYTISLTNTGNVAANNVIFTDTIPNGTTFIAGSLTVNGVANPGNPAPPTGVNVGTISPGQTTQILFAVKVNTIPSPNPIPNNSTVKYNFTMDPSVPNGATGSGNSNRVTTQVNTASIDNTSVTGNGANKTVDKAYASVGDTLNYTVVLKNTGNVAANNVVFTDTIPTGTTFNAGSVIINGAPNTGDPQVGINIGSLIPGQAATILFSVLVGQTVPNPNPIPNQGLVSYNYTMDPANPNGEAANGGTNIVNTTINSAIINNKTGGGLVKSVDKAYAKTKDILLYTINVQNTGNVTANNVILYDTIPTGTTFVVGSVKVNGTQQVSANPQGGVSINNIAPGQTVPVTFNVQITSTVPSPNPILNDSRVSFTYTVIPTVPNGRTGGGTSNVVSTQVNSPVIDNTAGGGLVKLVDKTYANIGDQILYTIGLKNTGNVNANNVVVTDTIPNGTSFVVDSLTQDGIPQGGAVIAPPTGYTIPVIGPGQQTTITFKVTVDTIPSPNPIPNAGTVNYVFTEDPAIPNGASGSGNTNIVRTTVNNGGFDPAKGGFTKLVDKDYAKVNDTLLYTIVLKNTGNVSVDNVVFKDTIPSGTTFTSGSVKLNGSVVPGNPNPQSGVSLGTVIPGAVNTITFNVVVNTIPSPNPIPNNGVVNYTYTVDPSVPNGISGGNISNIVNTQVNQANIDNTNGGGLVKSVDKAYAEVGDTLSYSFVVKNTGNVDANNVLLTDTVPNGTTYVPNTAKVNEVPVSITSPTSGIPVGTVAAGATSTVTFDVSVVSLPSPNPIPNSGTVNYSFVVNPVTQATANGYGNSNIVKTQINEAVIDNTVGGGFVKGVDAQYADIGQTLTYSFRMKNTGNVTAENIIFKDTIPNGTTFVNNSFTVNNVAPPGNPNPQNGINVGNIGPGATSTVIFKVLVVSIPTPNPIPDTATVSYNFTINPNNPGGGSGGGNTNTVLTQVNNANFVAGDGGIVKSVDKAYAKVNDILNYSVTLTNKGSVDAINIVFIDTIPNGTTFVNNSVRVNGAGQLGVNPQTGVNLPTITPNSTVNVDFQVVVNTVPTPNPIPNVGQIIYSYVVNPTIPKTARNGNLSNIVNTQVNDPNIGPNNGSFTKSANKTYATLGDTITYTIVAKNLGNVIATNVVIQDTVPNGTRFVTGTVFVNSINQPTADPQVGVNIGSLNPGQVATMTFDVLVTTIPASNPITDTAKISYNFTTDPSVPNGSSKTADSNTILNIINAAVIDNKVGGGLNKSVNLAYADIGYVLVYTIGVKNTGNVTATNVLINDTIPSGTSLVGNSVTVNGVTVPAGNPQTGVTVGTLAPNAASTVQFRVTVNTIPSPNPIPNEARSTYSYIVDPSIPTPITRYGLSNKVNTQVNNGTIDFNNGGGFVKTQSKDIVKIGDTLTYTLTLKNTGNVTVNNVILYDTVPNGASFIQGTATVNGNTVSVTDPASGIPVGSIGPSQTSTVVFSVLVTKIPSPNPMVNTATTKYTYTVDPALPNGASGGGNSNSVKAGVNQAIIDTASGGFNKLVDKAYADVGNTITYSIGAKNTGNATANNVTITDTIPNGTTFVAGSVRVNGVSQGSADPATGVNIGSLGPNQSTTMTFSVVVNTIPDPNPVPNAASTNFTYTLDPSIPDGAVGFGNTNIVKTQINHGEISNAQGGFVKSANVDCAGINDEIVYTIFVSNTGNVAVNNVVLTDTIPNATTFVANSVKVNGVTFTGVNPQSGINLNSIPPQGGVTVTFNVKVTTLPAGASTSNVALIKYNYTVNPATPNGAVAQNASNVVNTAINSAIIEGSGFTKAVDKAYADLGNILTYTLTLRNSGNTNALNVEVFDTIPNDTTFVTGSVTVNGNPQTGLDPQTGIPLGTLAQGTTAVVVYNVQINPVKIPNPNPIPNNADVVYQFETCPSLLTTVRNSSQEG